MINIEYSFCVIGIYICFLTWGVTQERVSTTGILNKPSSLLAYEPSLSKFKYFVYLNLLQSTVAAFIALAYLLLTKTKLQAGRKLLADYFKCSIFNSLASPFGYASLKHIDYPTLVLFQELKC